MEEGDYKSRVFIGGPVHGTTQQVYYANQRIWAHVPVRLSALRPKHIDPINDCVGYTLYNGTFFYDGYIWKDGQPMTDPLLDMEHRNLYRYNVDSVKDLCILIKKMLRCHAFKDTSILFRVAATSLLIEADGFSTELQLPVFELDKYRIRHVAETIMFTMTDARFQEAMTDV